MTGDEAGDKRERAGTPATPPRDDSPSAAGLAGLGFQILASILVCLYAGQWLDRRFGTKGIWTVAGVLLGAGAAIFSAYRRLTAAQRRQDAERRR
jgi:F0F1-type ATP synthase assembly protein I